MKIILGLALTLSLLGPVEAKINNDSINGLAASLQDRWQLTRNGIAWTVNDAHSDHIEFSGEQVSAIIYYGANEQGELLLNRKLVWPMLRTIPNDTHASLIHEFGIDISPRITINGVQASERLKQVMFAGTLVLQSELTDRVSLVRELAPSMTTPVVIEQYRLHNGSSKPMVIKVDEVNYLHQTNASNGVYGAYTIRANSSFAGEKTLAAGEAFQFDVSFSAYTEQDLNAASVDNAAFVLSQRQQYVSKIASQLVLETPDPVVNQMFSFAKLRAAESIFRTRQGLMHGPGGGRYYAAIWANDQAEYVNPFFPFLGDKNGNESALNSFEHFARFINPEFTPIPSSIVAEGTDIWAGVGDRGDCAMVAYGASRYALALGQADIAEHLLPLIDWCLEYNRHQLTQEGVIASDTDELEGRFPAGDVNLSTNTLAYSGLLAAADVYQSLAATDPHKLAKAEQYRQEALALRYAINRYFAATVEGFDTYRYYKGNDKLRAWIALPLVVGLDERQAGTLAALLSPKLWNENGIYTESGDKTFWDRATLYAFRGMFAAKETDVAMRYFKYYSRKRLLGQHVPYAVEAWPEGGQRHLSAESGLYARVVTEGLFGITPRGFNAFEMAPHLPTGWPSMCLKHVRAFNDDLDICAKRSDDKVNVVVSRGEKILFNQRWNGERPLYIAL